MNSLGWDYATGSGVAPRTMPKPCGGITEPLRPESREYGKISDTPMSLAKVSK